jgi:hypothetical protein
MAVKGFITQAGAEGYDTNAAVMDLLAMHGNDVTTPSMSKPMISSSFLRKRLG